MASKLQITWVKSTIGQRKTHRATIEALGLRRLQQSVEQPDNPSIRGMIKSVQHLVQVEEIGETGTGVGEGVTP